LRQSLRNAAFLWGLVRVKILETERLILRQMRAEDAEFIFELVNEAAFIRNIGDKGVRTLDDARNYILTGPVASYAKFGFGLYLVALRETGEAIGICGLLKARFAGGCGYRFCVS
jgi:ribosomal-protein-alanine N-acetyltransferase